MKVKRIMGSLVLVLALVVSAFAGTAPKSFAAETLNLKQISATGTTAKIQWTGTGSYKVTCSTLGLDITVTGNEYELTNLIEGSTYRVYVYPSGSYSSQGENIVVKTKQGKPSVYLSNYYLSTGKASANCVYSGSTEPDGYELKVYNYKGSCFKTMSSTSRYIYNVPMKKGQFNRIRVRAFSNISNGELKVYSDWSDYIYMGVMKGVGGKTTYYSKTKTIKAAWKKLKGVSKYVVYTCTKYDRSDRKKVKTLGKNATSITVKKHGKKTFSRNKLYYVDIVPYTKVSGKQKKSETFAYVY